MNILFVDDLESRFSSFMKWRDPGYVHQITHASTTSLACNLILQRAWDEIWLDHDNGCETGGTFCSFYPVACVIAAWRPYLNEGHDYKVMVHTTNEPAAKSMIDLMIEHGVDVERRSVLEWK